MDALELLGGGGKKKVVERRLTVRCRACGVDLACPPEKEFWAWLKCGDVLDFYKAHDGHRNLGAEIEHIEKE